MAQLRSAAQHVKYRFADRWLAARGGTAHVTLTDGATLRVDLTHPAQRAIFLGRFEPFERRMLAALAARGATVFDIGAHIGFHTTALAHAVGPSGCVHAFEPLPANAEVLVHNVAASRLGNVVINRVAVADRAAIATFHVPTGVAKTSMMGSLLSTSYAGATEAIEVEVVAIDDYCASRGIKRLDLIKMDVEGAEERVVAGMRETLTRYRPIVLCEVATERLEADGQPSDIVHRQFAELGYRSYLVENDRLCESDATITGNWLFIPSS